MTHDTLRGRGFLKSSIENWEETTFDIDYHIKGNTEINFGMAIYIINYFNLSIYLLPV